MIYANFNGKIIQRLPWGVQRLVALYQKKIPLL